MLVRNTQIEKELNRKSKPRYLGPYQIVRRTKGGSYVLSELDGAIWRQGIAAFRIIPYISRQHSQLSSPPNITTDYEESTDQDSDSTVDTEEDDRAS